MTTAAHPPGTAAEDAGGRLRSSHAGLSGRGGGLPTPGPALRPVRA